jgi:hypothetical protein
MDITPRRLALHVGLFLLTFVTTTLAGSEWVHGASIWSGSYTWQDFQAGIPYSASFLFILSVHEFGHYFTAVYHRVKVSLPYYIPLPPMLFMIGTLGALIRLRSRVTSKQQTFDIGIAGPLAGLIAALIVLWYGFATLPPPEYIFQFHPEYEQYGLDYANHVYSSEYMAKGTVDVNVGKNILYYLFERFVADPVRVPNVHEIMHYPFLLAGFLALVITSINLLPLGQLDGGHILYGLLGFERHRQVARVVFIAFVFYAGLGFIKLVGPDSDPLWYGGLYLGFLYVALMGLRFSPQDTLMVASAILAGQVALSWLLPAVAGYQGWLLFIFVIGRFIGVEHPPNEIEEPLSQGRRWLGWFALLVFVLTFAPAPLEIRMYAPEVPQQEKPVQQTYLVTDEELLSVDLSADRKANYDHSGCIGQGHGRVSAIGFPPGFYRPAGHVKSLNPFGRPAKTTDPA